MNLSKGYQSERYRDHHGADLYRNERPDGAVRDHVGGADAPVTCRIHGAFNLQGQRPYITCEHGRFEGDAFNEAVARYTAAHPPVTAYSCGVLGCVGRLVYCETVNGRERWTCASPRCLEVYRTDGRGGLVSTMGEPALISRAEVAS